MNVQYTRQRNLKSELLVTKKELMQTSAQDQFAKWAKLRRKVDTGIAELEKLSGSCSADPHSSPDALVTDGELATTKTAFSTKFNTLIWILTTGLQFAIGWWYRKSAVFYLPPNWFGPLTWTLALPFAPRGSWPLFDPVSQVMRLPYLGSVSVGIWQMACRRVIKVGERTIKNMIGKSLIGIVGLTLTSAAEPSEPAAVPVGASPSGEKRT